MAEEATTGATPAATDARRTAGLSPRIDAAVSHFARHLRHPQAGSASTRPPRPPRAARDGSKP